MTGAETRNADERAGCRAQKAKAKIRTIRIWAWVILALSRLNRPALPMRDVQTAGKTENCRVLREEYSVCRKMAKRFAWPAV